MFRAILVIEEQKQRQEFEMQQSSDMEGVWKWKEEGKWITGRL